MGRKAVFLYGQQEMANVVKMPELARGLSTALVPRLIVKYAVYDCHRLLIGYSFVRCNYSAVRAFGFQPYIPPSGKWFFGFTDDDVSAVLCFPP